MSSIVVVVKNGFRVGGVHGKTGKCRRNVAFHAQHLNVQRKQLYEKKPLTVDDFTVAECYPNVMNSSTHEPRNLVYYTCVQPTVAPSHNRQHSCLNGAKVMIINGL